jgi:4-amino-4-deoxy-L-arabinose transferase-like glycosyltransferase
MIKLDASTGRRAGIRLFQLLIVALLAAPLMFWNLGSRYLWQDEAATAVLAERMLEFGRPLGYDGRNLITMDYPPLNGEPAPPTDSATGGIAYFVERGDFRADTTWIGQPWGQFVLAALSMGSLGKSTFTARMPFALCGLLTAVLLWDLVRQRFRDSTIGAAAILLLLGNVFWVLHMRQCRYYAPASLMLLCTFVTYLRWRDGRRWGLALFVLAGFCLFQSDFGTFWPVIGVLTLDSWWSFRGRRTETAIGLALLAITVAPWVWYYQMFSRLKPRIAEFWGSLGTLIYSLNDYQFPLLALVILLAVVIRRRARGLDTAGETHTVSLAACVVLAVIGWVPLVTPYPFYRYLVAITPLSCLVLAYVCAGLVDLFYQGQATLDTRIAAVLPLAGILVCTRLVSLPVNIPIQAAMRLTVPEDKPKPPISLTLFRPELYALYIDLLNLGSDPNREVVEALRPLLRPDDAVLINYEDIPLMFYTDAEIRGGLSSFRVEDHSGTQPRFVVMRPQLSIDPKPFFRELERFTWRRMPIEIVALPWGNIPDPLYHRARYQAADLSKLDVFEAADATSGGLPFKPPTDEELAPADSESP